MSNPFKKGDEVRCIRPCLGGPKVGQIVTVDAPIGDHDIRPVGFHDGWLVSNFERAPLQVGDEVVWNKDEPRNLRFNNPESIKRTGTVEEVWYDAHPKINEWHITLKNKDGFCSSHYAYRFKLANQNEENSTVKSYTQEEITKAIIEYKSSASPEIRAQLIMGISDRLTRTYGRYAPDKKIPNEEIMQAVSALTGVCDEGKQKFVKYLQLEEEAKKPEQVYLVLSFKPGDAFDALGWSSIQAKFNKVRQLIEDEGLGGWSTVNLHTDKETPVGKMDDSNWSTIHGKGKGTIK